MSLICDKITLKNLRPHERLAFEKISKFYKIDIRIIPTGTNLTPDIEIKNLGIWEVKSPKGNSKNTIENNFKEAKGQAKNIIIDLSRTKMRSDVATRKVYSYVKHLHKNVAHVKILKRNGEIIDVL